MDESISERIFMGMLITGESHISVLFFFLRRCKCQFIEVDVYDSYRCLCELAKQIGFQDQAQNIFQLEQQLSTFRHVVSIVRAFCLASTKVEKITILVVTATRNGSTGHQVRTILEYRNKAKVSIPTHGRRGS